MYPETEKAELSRKEAERIYHEISSKARGGTV